MKTLMIIFLLIGVIAADLKPVKQFTVKSEIILSDAIGNIYSVNGNSITLFNNNGQKLFSYSNPFLGDIAFADVTDPMRILLFFKDFNQVVFLSNKLTGIGSPIELDNAGYNQISICCTSHSGGFWLFNSQALQLIHLKGNLEADYKGTILQSVFKENENMPVCLVEENNEIYMSVPKTGLLVFDKFGTYKRAISINDINYFQVVGGKIIYLSENNLISYSINNNNDTLKLPSDLNIISASINKNRLAATNGNEIFIFEL